MIEAAGLAGDREITETACQTFAKFKVGDCDVLPAYLKSAVFVMAVQRAADGPSNWETLLSWCHIACSALERNICLKALGQAQDPVLIGKTLDIALDSDYVKIQDISILLEWLRRTARAVQMRWRWMCENWWVITKRLPLSMLGVMVGLCVAGFTKDEHTKAVRDYFEQKNTSGFDRALEQSLETIQAKVRLIDREGRSLHGWLDESGFL